MLGTRRQRVIMKIQQTDHTLSEHRRQTSDTATGHTMSEAHPFPPERDWRYTQHEQFFAVYETNCRSVYLMQQRQKKHPLMEVFDGADTNTITSPRPLSTAPMVNGDLFEDHHRPALGLALSKYPSLNWR